MRLSQAVFEISKKNAETHAVEHQDDVTINASQTPSEKRYAFF